MMKKSTFGAALAFLAAAAGVLTAVAIYLCRREKELDEYERLLYSDDYDDFDEDGDDEDTIYEKIVEEPAAPQTDKAEGTAASEDELSF